MDTSANFLNLNNSADQKQLKNVITQKWHELHNTPNIFKYKLNVRKDKFLTGKWKFYVQWNPDRSLLRRIPQQIESLLPDFDESKFNFNKAKTEEVITRIKWKNLEFCLLINQSPLTLYHCLICPRINDNISQIINEESIEFSLALLYNLKDTNFRIGYNSPGALASVNHLHLHLMYLDKELLIDRINLIEIKSNLHITPENCPIKAFCFIFTTSFERNDFNNSLVHEVLKLIKIFCQNGIPHNLFFTSEINSQVFTIKLFIYVREHPCIVKDVLALNLAFCELSGYIPLGDEELYNKITEEYVVEKIQNEVGNIFEKLLQELIR